MRHVRRLYPRDSDDDLRDHASHECAPLVDEQLKLICAYVETVRDFALETSVVLKIYDIGYKIWHLRNISKTEFVPYRLSGLRQHLFPVRGNLLQ